MKTRILNFAFLVGVYLLPFALAAGCQKPATADKVREQTAAIRVDLSAARAKLAAGMAWVAKFVPAKPDAKTRTPTTAPAQTLPAPTEADMEVVGQFFADADAPLADAEPRLGKVDATADKIEQRAVGAETALSKERDHWIGYKGRVFLWGAAGVFVLALVGYLIITDGNGAFLFAIIRGVFGWVKTLAAHLLSGGILFFHNLKTAWLARRNAAPKKEGVA